MKKITLFLLFISSFSVWSQTSSGGGNIPSTGGSTGIKITIYSSANSDSIEIIPSLEDAKIIAYKLYNSNFQLTKDGIIEPTNNETITVEDVISDHYYIQLILDKEIENTQVISKQFIKE